MNVMNIVRNNAPSILKGMAIFGAGWCAVEAVKATPKAIQILDEKGIDVRKDPMGAVKACWRCYIFPAGIFIGTTGAILTATYLDEREMKKVVAALAWSEAKRQEYLNYERSIFGQSHMDEVEKAIQDDKMYRNNIPNEPLREGMMWCYEPESDQWFQTNTEQILWVELTANKMFANRGELRFNQFLSLFPYAKHDIPGLDYYGWFKYDDDGYWDFNWSFYPGGTPWIDIQPQINTKENYMVLKYGMHPGDDPDCNDFDDTEDPEQFEVKQAKS